MMLKLYVIKYQQFQNVTPQIIRVVVLPYNQNFCNNLRLPDVHSLKQYIPHQDQQESEFFGGEIIFQTQKQENRMINNPYSIINQPFDVNFEDIFCGKFAPNISTISISTRSNVSYDNYDMSPDFFIDDCLQGGLNQCYNNGQNDICPEIGLENNANSSTTNKEDKEFIGVQTEKDNEEKAQSGESSHDQTKNIPKNYIKAIFAFILQDKEFLQRLFQKIHHIGDGTSQVQNFIDYVRVQKKIKKYTIQRFKTLWLEEKYGKAMRILSSEFLRKRALGYISGSKIEKKSQHIRYRHKFIKAVENPKQFSNIK